MLQENSIPLTFLFTPGSRRATLMPVARPYIPTVDEMKRLAEAKQEALKQGVKMPTQPQVSVIVPVPALTARLERRAEEMEARIEELTGRVVAQRRRTPQELRDSLLALFERDDFSPAEEMYAMYRETDGAGHHVCTPDQRIKLLQELTSLVMPKLKTVEVRGHIDHQHRVIIKRYGEDGKVMIEAPKVAEPRQFDLPLPREQKPVADAEVVDG